MISHIKSSDDSDISLINGHLLDRQLAKTT